MILIVLPDIATEDELLARVRRGERQAIRQVYQAYFPPLYQFVRLRVDEGQTAEDIVSDVFTRLVAAAGGKNSPRHSLRGWLFGWPAMNYSDITAVTTKYEKWC